jgi:O-antigen/teichoic acid export membrane protein
VDFGQIAGAGDGDALEVFTVVAVSMTNTTSAPKPTEAAAASGRWAFFKQSGWMVIATVGGGLFMTAVHTLAGHNMPANEYSAFYALLRFFIWLGIPAAGLQNVFAQQAAAALTHDKVRHLEGTTKAILRAMFVLWLATGIFIVVCSHGILSTLKVSNPAALWWAIVLGLTTLWVPIFKGLLQGKHHFAGFGWMQIIDGVGRFAALAVMLMVFGKQAASGMAGCVIGQIATLALGFWLTRDVWRGEGKAFAWKPWLARVIPLTFGLGAILFITATDALFVQSTFAEDRRQLYMGANLTGFAVMMFVQPIAMVMFPRVVRSVAKSETTDAMKLTFGLTAAVGIMAGLTCSVMPTLPLHIIYFGSPKMLAAAPLVPWFVWCLLPLTLSNVLITNLLAHEKYGVVPFAVAISIGYICTLFAIGNHLQQLSNQMQAFTIVVQMLGYFSTALLAACAWFTWGMKGRAQSAR